jgi:hypothetical protein
VALAAAGVVYWAITRADALRCIYGDAVCSLTVGTYLLVVVTGTAFLAAYRAARFAARALAHEQRSAIVIQGCREGHQVTTEMFVRFEDRALAYIQPWRSDEDKATYKAHDFDVISVGRSPVVDAVIPVVVKVSDGQGDASNDAHVGSMRADGQRHVRIWVPERFGDVMIHWAEDEATHGDDERLICHAERNFPGSVVYVKRFDAQRKDETEIQVRRELPAKPQRRTAPGTPQVTKAADDSADPDNLAKTGMSSTTGVDPALAERALRPAVVKGPENELPEDEPKANPPLLTLSNPHHDKDCPTLITHGSDAPPAVPPPERHE